MVRTTCLDESGDVQLNYWYNNFSHLFCLNFIFRDFVMINCIFSPADMVSHMNRENTMTRQNLNLSNIDLTAARKAASLADLEAKNTSTPNKL